MSSASAKGAVQAIFDALVERVAHREQRPDLDAILDDNRRRRDLAECREQRAVAVLEEVMIGGVDLDRAEVRDERARVHRIGIDSLSSTDSSRSMCEGLSLFASPMSPASDADICANVSCCGNARFTVASGASSDIAFFAANDRNTPVR